MTTLPAIHLNGTGVKELHHEYRVAYKAARAAREALAAATCNGRDFYPLGDDAFRQARDEREQHLRHLNELVQYLEDWAVHTLGD